MEQQVPDKLPWVSKFNCSRQPLTLYHLSQKTNLSDEVSIAMWEKGYAFWRDIHSRDMNIEFADEEAERQHDMWSEYLQGAAGIRELVMADSRSVHPGLWNDRWELPYPYVRRLPKFAIDIPAEASVVDTLKSIVNTLEEGKNHVHHLRNKVYEYYTTVGLCQLGVDRKQREEDEQRETEEGPKAGEI